MSNKTNSIYGTARWKKLRVKVLAEEPTCHWCQRAPATQVDHLVELAAGGEPYERSNLVGACAPCNTTRGALYGNAKKQQMIKTGEAIRPAHDLFSEPNTPPRPLLASDISPNGQIEDDSGDMAQSWYEPGKIEPRLVTAGWGGSSYGGQVAAWAEKHLGVTLYPWQQQVIEAFMQHDENGRLRHRYSLTSTARQQGKTVMLAALVGWWLTEGVAVRGEPQQVLTVAHQYTTAELLPLTLFPILEETFGWKTYISKGRMMATHENGGWWRVQSATPKAGHGLSVDLLVIDELFAVDETVVDAGLLPTQRARRAPLAVFTSTAGTEDSLALIRWRERGIQQIEKREPGRMHFAEWSPPPNIDFNDRSYWHWANPSLGLGALEHQDLEDGFASPNREAWLRTDLNLWTSAVGSWLPVNTWENLACHDPMPAGGTLAIDSDSDAIGFVGVRVAARQDRKLQARSEFRVDSLEEMWDKVRALIEDKQIAVALTPGLYKISPPEIHRRAHMWGQMEMTQYTAIVRGLIMEGKLTHENQMSLNEHVNRAVAGKAAGGALTITSRKSPGPIEQCRCMIAAAGYTAKPSANVRVPMIGTAN